jgi:hypothetical protein
MVFLGYKGTAVEDFVDKAGSHDLVPYLLVPFNAWDKDGLIAVVSHLIGHKLVKASPSDCTDTGLIFVKLEVLTFLETTLVGDVTNFTIVNHITNMDKIAHLAEIINQKTYIFINESRSIFVQKHSDRHRKSQI